MQANTGMIDSLNEIEPFGAGSDEIATVGRGIRLDAQLDAVVGSHIAQLSEKSDRDIGSGGNAHLSADAILRRAKHQRAGAQATSHSNDPGKVIDGGLAALLFAEQ